MLHRGPYGDVHRTSFGDVLMTSTGGNFAEWGGEKTKKDKVKKKKTQNEKILEKDMDIMV